MGKKLSYEEVKKYIESFEYTLLSKEYINNSTKLSLKCDKEHIYDVRFNDFKQGYRCPICNGKIRHTFKYIKEYVESYGYLLLSNEYKNNYEYLESICQNGHFYKFRFNNFLKGHRCSICKGNNKKTYSYIKKFIDNCGDILISEEYINAHSKLLIKCGKCNKINEMSWNEYQQNNSRCYCSKGINWNLELVKNYSKLYGYEILDNNYKNNNQKINMICKNGHNVSIKWSHFVDGIRCKYCSMSSGEQEVARILDKYNIEYDIQHKFDDCKNKQSLPFDFHLPKYNILIEFDGKQHYKVGCFNMTLLDSMNLKRRDKIKTNYCIDNNIKLIRIPYWEFKNMENILIKELNINK